MPKPTTSCNGAIFKTTIMVGIFALKCNYSLYSNDFPASSYFLYFITKMTKIERSVNGA
jgi:hypothetical protein